jgi:hypothetical protein
MDSEKNRAPLTFQDAPTYPKGAKAGSASDAVEV